MDIEKLLEQVETQGIDAIKAAIEELKRQRAQAYQEEDAACQAYFADAEKREAKVKQQLAGMAQQEEEIKRKITAMQPELANATISGDFDTFKRIQADLADLEAKRGFLAKQIQLLSSAKIPGNLELYNAANAKDDARIEAVKQLAPAFAEIKSFVYDHV